MGSIPCLLAIISGTNTGIIIPIPTRSINTVMKTASRGLIFFFGSILRIKQ
jgi:hypothetical protein